MKQKMLWRYKKILWIGKRGTEYKTEFFEVEVMAKVKDHCMVRRSGALPFVVSFKRDLLPLHKQVRI